MKQIMIITIIILTIIFAINYVKKIKLHIKALNQCELMVENMEMLLSHSNLSIKEIFNSLSNNQSYYLLSFIPLININLQKNINSNILNNENICHIKNNKYLNNEDKEILINFFSMLGKSDLNGQISNCKMFKDTLKNRLEENKHKELSECKSSGVIIIGIGFFIVIMII